MSENFESTASANSTIDPHQGFSVAPFRVVPWLRGPHAQTVGARQLRFALAPPVAGVRERWETPDGDFIDLDFGPTPSGSVGFGPPLVLLLHGLEGSSQRGYIRGAMRALVQVGIQSVAFNFRSCSGEPNRLARFYHSGETEDLRWVLEGLKARFPQRALGALGYSLGGNVLLKALGEPKPLPVKAAVAISVPFDLAAGTQRLETRVSGRLYTHYFLRSLLSKVEAKASLLRPRIDLARLMQVKTLRAFDDLATAPLHGFRDADAYYAASSSGPFLAGIRTPTLLLHARNDPFLPESAIPESQALANPWILPAFPERGGHVGFVGRSRANGVEFWAEARAAEYLVHLLTSPVGGRMG